MNKKTIPPEPGLRVRSLREKLGRTRAQFHKETGVNASTLRAVEVGEIRLSVSRATTLSHMFVLLYGLELEEASVDVLLHGEMKAKESGTDPAE